MRHLQRCGAALCAALMSLLATGCSFRLATSPEDLYSLPQLPTEYTELNNCIKALIEDGAEYAAPVSGTNIQPVQLVDLNGDGQEEALAFLRKSTDEKPLKIYIFSKRDQSYDQTAVIQSSGTSIYSVTYSDLDDDGQQELIVGWKVAPELQALTVYTPQRGEPVELMRTNYVKYAVTRLDGTAKRELVVLRADDEGGGVADYYTWRKDTLERSSAARLSMTMAELNSSGSVTAGSLSDGQAALFVTGVSDSGEAITDILTPRNGELTNVALSDITGVSTEVYRFLSLYPMDINGDGITEVPAPQGVPGRSGSTAQIDWRSYGSDGAGRTVETTCHNLDDGWYLTLPDAWRGKILTDRSQSDAGETAVTFSIRGSGNGEPRDFLRIYTITGSGRTVSAVRGNRFILSRQSETIYSAELLSANAEWDLGITEDELCGCFHLITGDWTSGDSGT